MIIQKALINAGGFGTRMAELTKEIPKPLLKVNGKAVIDYSIEQFRDVGVQEIAISVHHMADKIQEHCGDGSKWGIKIVYLYEPEPLGTAGCLTLYKNWFDRPFFMCNADELRDVDLHHMIREHYRHQSDATIALTMVEDPTAYGVAELQGTKIVRFVEKPTREEAPSTLINSGLYLINHSAVERLPYGYSMIEKDLFPVLAKENRLQGFIFHGRWNDIGTPERYALAQQEWAGVESTPPLLMEKELVSLSTSSSTNLLRQE